MQQHKVQPQPLYVHRQINNNNQYAPTTSSGDIFYDSTNATTGTNVNVSDDPATTTIAPDDMASCGMLTKNRLLEKMPSVIENMESGKYKEPDPKNTQSACIGTMWWLTSGNPQLDKKNNCHPLNANVWCLDCWRRTPVAIEMATLAYETLVDEDKNVFNEYGGKKIVTVQKAIFGSVSNKSKQIFMPVFGTFKNKERLRDVLELVYPTRPEMVDAIMNLIFSDEPHAVIVRKIVVDSLMRLAFRFHKENKYYMLNGQNFEEMDLNNLCLLDLAMFSSFEYSNYTVQNSKNEKFHISKEANMYPQVFNLKDFMRTKLKSENPNADPAQLDEINAMPDRDTIVMCLVVAGPITVAPSYTKSIVSSIPDTTQVPLHSLTLFEQPTILASFGGKCVGNVLEVRRNILYTEVYIKLRAMASTKQKAETQQKDKNAKRVCINF